MSENFDPYYTWLGIPPPQQPPHHYRLLGVELFEGSPDVIERAADRCMADLRTYQTGKHSADSQRLLNEVASAKVCLLNPEKKAAYDAALREKLAAQDSGAVDADVFSVPAETATAGASVSAMSKARSRPNIAMIGAIAAAGVAVVLIAAWVLLSGGTGDSPGPEATAVKTPAAPARPVEPSEKQEPNGEAGKSQSAGAAPPMAENPPKKAEEPPGTFAGITPPAPEPGKMADQPASPPAAVQPGSAEPGPAPAEEAKKRPIPSAEIQQAVGGTIEETYKLSEAKTPEAKLKLAAELADVAKKTTKPDEQYVLLRKATELACEGGDAALMLQTVGSISDAFAIDPFAAKVAMLERFAKGPRSPARVQSLVEGSRSAIDDAVAEDRYETALSMAKSVADACSRSAPPLRKEAADRRKRVQQLQKHFDEVQKAQEGLKTNPEDAEANLTVGSWHCFVKDDWKTGLAHLAKGSDAVLKALAQRELTAPPAGPEDQVKLADGWWDAAADRRGEEKATLLRCAGHWYEQALGRLEGINKTKVEKRLAEIAELGQAPASRGGREPPPAVAPFDAKRARAYQAQWARYLKVPVEFTNAIGMKFVLIPPGEFDMGSTQEEIGRLLNQARQQNLSQWYMERLPFEVPRHRVRITQAFYLGHYGVTQAQFQQVMGSNPSAFKDSGADAPVEMVSWNDAVSFCQRLSALPAEKITGGVYRLPTEAEWEYAARAGTTTAWCFGDDMAALSEYAWWSSNSAGKTHPVGQKRPNAFLLFDMPGNVWQWCADWFSADHYAKSPTSNPVALDSGTARVARGGSCNAIYCEVFRSAYRSYLDPGTRANDVGFRVTRSLPGQATSPKGSKRAASAGSRGSGPLPAVAPFSAEEARKHQERWAEYLKVPAEQTNSIGMTFVLIPPGEFMMGSPESDRDAANDEKPQHRVRLTKPFCLGAHEVTVGQFGRFAEETGYKTDMEKRGISAIWRNAIPGQTNDHPVVGVSWNDAVAFGEWLSKKEGHQYRLPTEAEWEFACRAGSQTRYCFGDDPKDLSQCDWVAENSDGRTHPVGQKKSNAWALFDMHGSVLEWCADWYGLYSKVSSDDPVGPNAGSFRVLCGGCWGDRPPQTRSARRGGGGSATAGNNVGFRIARTLLPQTTPPR